MKKITFNSMNLITFFAPFAMIATVASAQADATPVGNVPGINGRLDSIRCEGAYFAKGSDFTGPISKKLDAACGNLANDELSRCTTNALKSLMQPAPNAVFLGSAVADQITFQMTITENGKTLFSSLRTAFNAQASNVGSILDFDRVGTPSGHNDNYEIESDGLSDDNTYVPTLTVPVHRRLAPDLVYVFTNGCSIEWSGASLQ